MLFGIVFLLPVVFGFPDLKVNWDSPASDSIVVQAAGQDDLLTQCLKGGLDATYRYQIRLCKPRTMWFSKCKPEQVEIHTARYDAISDSYTVKWDRLGDLTDPESISADSLEAVKKALGQSRQYSVEYLSGGDKDFSSSSKLYFEANFSSECRGEYNRTLARISYVLTLGLVRISGSDTGWVRFALANRGNS